MLFKSNYTEKPTSTRFFNILAGLIVIITFLFASPGTAKAEEKDWQEHDDRSDTILVNTRAILLDRTGKRQVITDVYDSFESNYFIVSSGRMGQSPIYRIPKNEVLSIEFDGFYQNMSGWDYANAWFVLTGDRRFKCYVKVFHAGLNGYRTFQGKAEWGDIMISWKKVKKIEFAGDWIEVPKAKDEKKKEEVIPDV